MSGFEVRLFAFQNNRPSEQLGGIPESPELEGTIRGHWAQPCANTPVIPPWSHLGALSKRSWSSGRKILVGFILHGRLPAQGCGKLSSECCCCSIWFGQYLEESLINTLFYEPLLLWTPQDAQEKMSSTGVLLSSQVRSESEFLGEVSSPSNQFLLSVSYRTVICRQNRGQAEIWPDHPKLLYAKKSIFLSRDCHYKIKHCPKVTAVGIPITRFSYLPSDVSCEYLFQRNRKIASGWEGGRSPVAGLSSRAGVWGLRRDLSELQNNGCDFRSACALSSNFINLKVVFSEMISSAGVFPLQKFHVSMKGTSACESGQGLIPQSLECLLKPLCILFICANLCKATVLFYG